MGESEIEELISNTSLNLAESRIRCIVDNAKCIVKASTKSFYISTKKKSFNIYQDIKKFFSGSVIWAWGFHVGGVKFKILYQ